MQDVTNFPRLGRIASRVPNIQLDLLWPTFLAVAWHLHNLVLVFASHCRWMFDQSLGQDVERLVLRFGPVQLVLFVRHELMDDGGLTDRIVAEQNDFSLRGLV